MSEHWRTPKPESNVWGFVGLLALAAVLFFIVYAITH